MKYIVEYNKFHPISGVESFINEGGNALKNIVQPILQEQIPETLEWIQVKILNELGCRVQDEDWAVLGSAGKKPSGQFSGDIDIGILMDSIASNFQCSMDEIKKHIINLVKKLGLEYKDMPGLGIISIAVPIEGSEMNGYVQTDLMFSADLNWSKFAYHSPDYRIAELKYKQIYRTLLFMVIFRVVSMETIDKFDDDTIKTFQYLSYQLNKGLVKVRKSFEGKTGKKLSKAQTIPELSKELIANNPQSIINSIFTDVSASSVLTFDDLWKELNSPSFQFPEKIKEITETFIQELNDNKLPIPSEVYHENQ